jgi:hypothetical protein
VSEARISKIIVTHLFGKPKTFQHLHADSKNKVWRNKNYLQDVHLDLVDLRPQIRTATAEGLNSHLLVVISDRQLEEDVSMWS